MTKEKMTIEEFEREDRGQGPTEEEILKPGSPIIENESISHPSPGDLEYNSMNS